MNATQPTSSPLPDISVTLPLTQAIDRVKLVLFQPFDIGKWFVIGFCTWLAQLGESGGGGGGGNFNPGGGNHRGGGLGRELEQAKEFLMSNLYWIIPVAVGVVLLCVVLGLLFTWLNSRGKFMFLHCVALNRAEVAVPWTKYSRPANSLFWFRIVLGLIATVLILPVIVLGVVIGLATFPHGHVAAGIAGVTGAALLFVALALGFFLIRKFTMDFVVPIMFVRGCTCREGWYALCQLMSANVGNILLYLLFQVVIALVTGMLVLAVMMVTCCCCCLLLLPYVSTVILLPVFVFHRAYSAHYLAQFGRAFDVFALPAA